MTPDEITALRARLMKAGPEPKRPVLRRLCLELVAEVERLRALLERENDPTTDDTSTDRD